MLAHVETAGGVDLGLGELSRRGALLGGEWRAGDAVQVGQHGLDGGDVQVARVALDRDVGEVNGCAFGCGLGGEVVVSGGHREIGAADGRPDGVELGEVVGAVDGDGQPSAGAQYAGELA